MFIKLLKQVNSIWWSEIDLFEIIPDTAVSSKLFENMLSMIVVVVRVILVGYVMFGSKELDVIMSKKLSYVIFSLIFN